MKFPLKFALMASLLAIAGCTEKSAPAIEAPVASREAGPQVIATIQDIMQSLVDPAADSLWDSVSTTVTAAGTEEKQPRSDEEWAAVRHHAIVLVEAANLLVMPDRKVAVHGKTLEDAHVEGINTPEIIEAMIASDRASFIAHAQHLQQASNAALTAIDKRDVAALVGAGGKLDEACESCHMHYWYPNAPKPPEL